MLFEIGAILAAKTGMRFPASPAFPADFATNRHVRRWGAIICRDYRRPGSECPFANHLGTCPNNA